MSDSLIDRTKNYKRYSSGDVFTGEQIANLLQIASPIMQAIILLDICETDEQATDPKSKYGIAEKGCNDENKRRS